MRKFIICALMIMLAIPCEAKKKNTQVTKSPQEIKAMTTKQYDSSKKLLVRASLSMLQSEGFLIDDANIETGLIKASKRIEADKRNADSKLAWKGKAIDASTAKFSVYIDEINDSLSDVRFTLYDGVEMSVMGFGYVRTRSSKVIEEMVQDAEVYSRWFNSLSAELQRINAVRQ